MSDKIILYDLPSKDGRGWSLNPFKARAALNYKNLSYTTEWVEYPDLAPKFKSFGIPPNDPKINQTPYSIPAARFPADGGTYIMDSLAIAHKLEEIQPKPSLHLDSAYVERSQKAISGVLGNLAPIWLPRVPVVLLNEPSAVYFTETREKRFGMPLSELAKSEQAGETAWTNAEASIRDVKTILHENTDGPLVLGKEVSFADFVIGGFWVFMRKLGEDDLFGRLMKYDEAFPKHYEAVKQYFERDDY